MNGSTTDLILQFIFRELVRDVFFDLLFIFTYCTYIVTAAPEVAIPIFVL